MCFFFYYVFSTTKIFPFSFIFILNIFFIPLWYRLYCLCTYIFTPFVYLLLPEYYFFLFIFLLFFTRFSFLIEEWAICIHFLYEYNVTINTRTRWTHKPWFWCDWWTPSISWIIYTYVCLFRVSTNHVLSMSVLWNSSSTL